MESTSKHSVRTKSLPGSKILIEATISAEEFESTRKEALKHIGSEVELPGFRKGHVPEKILVSKIGEAALLEEMAEIAIGRAYPNIVVAEKIDAIGRPNVRITKIAHGNPLEFSIETAVFPSFTLPDYRAIAKKASKASSTEVIVSDEDLESTLSQVRRMKAQEDARKEGKEFSEDSPLPELSDEFARSLGAFTDMADMKTKVRENLLREKTREVADKRRIAIMDAIAGATTIEIPEIIIEQEVKRMEEEFTADVARMGLDFEGYLSATKKTRDELHESWKPDATKRAKIQLIIGRIADAEKAEPDPAQLDADTKALCERYPDANPERARAYIHMLLTNEKVFTLLEGGSPQENS